MQVPLIRNPAFQPPKAITLNQNYSKLLPTLTASVVPPKINLSKDELESWIEELNRLKDDKFDESNDLVEINKFKQWVKDKQTKVAPGFDTSGGVMVPARLERKVEPEIKENDDIDQKVNELDRVFGKTVI